jgi:tetratricopeptide (TPR) repeat protein
LHDIEDHLWSRSVRHPPDISRLLDRAVAAHQSGSFVEAERLYKTVLASEPDHFDALHLLGFLNYQRGRLAEAVKLLSAAVQRNASSADALWNLGLAWHGLQHWEEALASYTAALALDPENPDLLNVHAVALLDVDRSQEALAQIDRVLNINPRHVEALGNRGNAFVKLNRPEEAIAAYDAALRLTGADAQLLTNRAHVFRRLDRLEDAVADLRKAIALHPDFAEAHFELGMAQLALGDFENGWQAYERRWATVAFAGRRRSFKSPLWTGEQSLRGKTVLLHAEQGFGDTIQFARYAPMVAALGATVILEVQPELISLLSGTAGVARIIARGQKFPRFDLHCPLMSLPRAFKTGLATIPADLPYIEASDAQVQAWAQRLPARRPLVGVAWAGHRSHGNDLNRSLPLACLAPIFHATTAQFIALQRELRPGDAEILREHPDVLNWGADLHDFADTAALIAQLDAVVSVDTAVAHLAGAMGKRLFLLLPYAADFRWLRARNDSPWYPTARLLRQPKFSDWESVVESLGAQLASLA